MNFFQVVNFFLNFFFSRYSRILFFKYNYLGVLPAWSRAKNHENTPRGPHYDRHIFQKPADLRTQNPADRRTVVAVRRSAEKSEFFRGLVAFCALWWPLCTQLRFRKSEVLRPGNRRNVVSEERNSHQLTSGWIPNFGWRAEAPGLKPLHLPRAQWSGERDFYQRPERDFYFI